ncbi:MAG: hypothetical protein R3A79_20650 [Nannocystaceae bacterium]
MPKSTPRAGEPALWRAVAFAAGDLARAQAAVARALRDLRALWRSSPAAACEQAVAWVAALPAALAEVDDPEGRLAHQLGRALGELAPRLIHSAAEPRQREAWADRLWPALAADERGHLAPIADVWGELVADAEAWAARLFPEVCAAWNEGHDARASRACLSALSASGRQRDVLELLALRPIGIWPERRFGVLALAALGDADAAIAYARGSNVLGHPYEEAIAAVCEDVLLAAGRRDEAYAEFAQRANRRQNYLTTFRCLVAKYPEREPATILSDLIAASPGEEGRWFATARSLRYFNLAAEIAQRAPCDPRTLNRAAGERLVRDPSFALDVALASLRWIAEGHGHVIDGVDVLDAYDIAVEAARRLGRLAAARERMLQVCEGNGAAAVWVRHLLEPQLAEDA